MLALGLFVALAAPARASGHDGPRAMMMETTDRVLKALREEGPGLSERPDRLYRIIDKLILPHFNFRRMSGWVLGRYWRGATPQQKEEFVRAFQDLLVRTYSRALIDYRDQRIDFVKSRIRSDTEVTVRAEIDQGGGPKIPVSYEMSLNDGRWQVYDVAVNGVSLVINYRSEFGQVVKRNGLDGLIQRLTEHNATKS
jgi:phospholipid transport system substrate-binding protein